MKPGAEYPFESSFVQLRHFGILCADHLEISMSYIPAGADERLPSVSADDMARMMEITRLEYYNPDWRIDLLTEKVSGRPPRPYGYRVGDWSVADVDGDGRVTFYDLGRDPLDDLPPPQYWMGDGGSPYMKMSVRFAEDAGNEYMGAGINASLVYTLNQFSGQ